VNGIGDILRNKRVGWDVIFGFPLQADWLTFSVKLKKERVSPRSGENAFSAYTLNSLSGILSYQTVDHWTNPTKGTYWKLKFEKGGNLGFYQLTGLDYSKISFNVATFFSITSNSVLALHNNMGVFRPHGQEARTFEAEGYEIGGASTLRGYKENTPFTGFRKILFNFEYRYNLTPSFQTVLFYDFGKTFNTDWNFNYNSFNQGKGFGFRLSTPIGAIRTDFAWGETDFIIHFNLGQVF
jgi:outer membrane protein insertion porin family